MFPFTPNTSRRVYPSDTVGSDGTAARCWRARDALRQTPEGRIAFLQTPVVAEVLRGEYGAHMFACTHAHMRTCMPTCMHT